MYNVKEEREDMKINSSEMTSLKNQLDTWALIMSSYTRSNYFWSKGTFLNDVTQREGRGGIFPRGGGGAFWDSRILVQDLGRCGVMK